MLIKDIESYKEFQEYMKNNKFIIINISASWCKPCNVIKPLIENFISSIDNTEYIYLKIDYSLYNVEDEFEKLFNAKKIPYFAVIKEGIIVESIISGDYVHIRKTLLDNILCSEFKIDEIF
jgi:thiol-disulfide isomerase/thioredoxin